VIVYISIGNSDDKLTQRQWSCFISDTLHHAHHHASEFHGYWLSSPESPWQNACFSVEFSEDARWPLDERVPALKTALRELARRYRQESIVWAEAPKVEFLGAPPTT
jgi:hypothetical protein